MSDMIPQGTYPAVVVPVDTDFGELACQFGRSKNKGTPQIAVSFEILRGPYAGRVVSWIGYLTDNTEERTLKSLRICGFVGDDMAKFHEQRPTNEVAIVVEHEEYQSRKRVKVAWVNAPNRGFRMEDQLVDKDLAKFAAQFKAKLKTIKPIKTTEAKREAPTSGDTDPAGDDMDQSPPDDGEIPF